MIRVLEVNVDDHLYGGVYVLVKNIIRLLPENIKADIAALEPFDKEEHIEEFRTYGSTVYYVGSKRNKLLKQLDIYKNVKKLIDQNRYDVVHLHSDVSHKILVSALAAQKSKIIVFHSHANDVEGKHKQLRRAFHRVCCWFLKLIPAIYVATSEDAGKWMYPWAKKDDIIILDNGIDYSRFEFAPEKREEIRKELSIKDDVFLIGLFGRFVYQKNPLFAIKIFKAICEESQTSRLLCIGEGPLKEEFIQLLRQEGLYDKAIFIGNTDTIEDYYQAIDALIMPSNFEGFGLVAVESQISGTPTFVSTNVPKITKISNLICYLPIEDEMVQAWCEGVLETRNYVKHNVNNEIDNKYELRVLVDRIAKIYKGWSKE